MSDVGRLTSDFERETDTSTGRFEPRVAGPFDLAYRRTRVCRRFAAGRPRSSTRAGTCGSASTSWRRPSKAASNPDRVLMRVGSPGAGPGVKLVSSAEGTTLGLMHNDRPAASIATRTDSAFIRLIGADGKERAIAP